MQTYLCEDKCCVIKIKIYKPIPRYFDGNRKKSGIFIYDPLKDKVLLVQSHGNLWGSPKGSLNECEKNIEGAIREVKEETGLIIDPKFLLKKVIIMNATYYYTELVSEEIEVQSSEDNDANGITWIKIKCLENAIKNGNMILNHHSKIIFWKFINKKFPKYNYKEWILVKNKKSRKII